MSAIKNCIICGKEGKLMYKLGGYSVRECKDCELKWVEDTYDESDYVKFDYYWGYDYFIKNEKYFRKLARKELDIIVKEFDKLDIKEKKLVDFGCGFGYLISEGKKIGFEVTGVEAKSEVVEQIRKREKLNVISSLIKDVNLPHNNYSVATFFDVLEHLIEPDLAIKKARDVLAPGGLLVIEVPDDKSLFRKIAYFQYKITGGKFQNLLKGAFQSHPGGHRYGFTKKSLTKLLENNGFQIIKFKKVMMPYKFFISEAIRKKKFLSKIIYFLMSTFLFFVSLLFFMQNRIKVYAKKV